MSLIKDSSNINAVRWADQGIGFVIIKEEEFSKTILPRYFKHSNYSSFVRQLNMYNFHKIRENNNQSHFHHECFVRDDKELLSGIRRKTEKKKRKNGEDSEEENECENNHYDNKSDVSMKKRIKHSNCKNKDVEENDIEIKSYTSPTEKKVFENTRHAFGSEKENKENIGSEEINSKNWPFPKSEPAFSKERISIQNIICPNEVEEDKLSINNEINEVFPKHSAHEFFFPSNNNIYPFPIRGANFPHLNIFM